MFENGLFAGVDSVPDFEDYPPVEIETRKHITHSDNATITTMVKSVVDQSTEAGDTTKKKPEDQEKKLTTQEQPCKHCCRSGYKYLHKDIKEENCFMKPHKKGDMPPWATKKLKNLNIEIKA